jgi:uncharacterized RDD family membrane protein YckC
MQIYVTKDEERAGPFSLEEVNRRLAAGLLNPADEAWYEGSPGWRALLSIPGVIMPGGASSTAESVTIATPARTRSTAYGGFWIRTLAYVIDTLIIVILSEIIVQFLKYFAEDVDLSAVAITLPLLISFIYMTIQWSSVQATIGQKLCGLKVVNAITETKISFLRAVGRWFALLLAMFILFVGVIMVAFTERKRGLHDMLAGTYVVKSE